MNKISAIQDILGVNADGVWGAESQLALDAALHPAGVTTVTPTDSSRVDDRSEANIATLHPTLQPIARKFIQTLAANGITAKIISGTRTYNQQNELYAQGRTSPGRIVTNAQGGHSNHNFGVAFDIGIFQNGAYLNDSPLYRQVSVFGKQLGLSWGGDWKSIQDEPHYELKPDWAQGLSEADMLAQLRQKHDANQDVMT